MTNFSAAIECLNEVTSLPELSQEEFELVKETRKLLNRLKKEDD